MYIPLFCYFWGLISKPTDRKHISFSSFPFTARVSLMSWLKIDTAREITIRPSFESGCSAAPQITASTANASQNWFSGWIVSALKGSKLTQRQIKMFGRKLLGRSSAAESRFSTPETDGYMHVACYILIHATSCVTVWENQTRPAADDSFVFYGCELEATHTPVSE